MLDEFDITNLAHCDAVQGGGIHPISCGRVWNPTLSAQHPFPVVSKHAVRIDISIKRDRLDAQFCTELRHGGVSIFHGSLSHPDLGFC